VRRRELLFGALGSIVYLACGGDEGSRRGSGKPGDEDGTTDDADPSRPVVPTSRDTDSHRLFPQGLASGDPRPARVVLWTRIDPVAAGKAPSDDIEIELILARDEELTDIVARTTLVAAASADHTVRVVPTELEPGRHYYYRFEREGTTTLVGRTKTAPTDDADVPVKFVFAACQDYIGRYYHAWKALLDEKPDLDFILFLGDYIYESVNDTRFQSTETTRKIDLPNGMDTSPKLDGSRIAAATLADYRTLYKAYRSEPLLREVHRRYPFIVTWDDHEFADDCWQDHSTSFNGKDPVTGDDLEGDEKNTARRTAANRAFFDHQPIDVVYKENFTFPFDIKIYRTLRWGKHVELFLTDQRSYRADHLVPEGGKVDFSVGKFLNYNIVGTRYFVRKPGFDPMESAAKPTLLGAAQKTWFVDAVKKSTATWKVWGNEVMVYQMALDLWRLPGVPDKIFGFTPYTAYLNADQWDGYRSERAEILGAFEAANIENLLVCTGDIHSFHAAELHTDFDAPGETPVGVEYVTAGISSSSLNGLIAKLLPSDSPLAFVTEALLGGANEAFLASNEKYLRYTDSDSYGFAFMTIDGSKAEAEFVHTGVPTNPTDTGVKSRDRFVTKVGTNRVTKL